MADDFPKLDFIRDAVRESKERGEAIVLRFPPEPNGYLHVGHAKAITLNFSIAEEFGGRCNLRMDDTNPLKENVEFERAIQEDVRWLGFEWDGLFYASDYFGQLVEWAEQLIRQGDAYVDSLSADDIKAYRGTPLEVGRNSPYRDRSVEENLALFARMKAGEMAEGEAVLRAKIDMASPNYNMRDPALFRIRHAHHHRTGDRFCIYPMYDFAHPLSDAIEGITHSLCTLEFEHHRPLYDWCIEKVNPPAKPRQIEFSRLSLEYTLTSKRYLKKLVDEGVVTGWDDPRMPTIRGLRRRGVPSRALREFALATGVTKFNGVTELAKLDFHIRDVLNREAQRRMGVFEPLKVTIENWPAGHTEWLEAVNNPEDESAGARRVPMTGTLWIERDDFMLDPPKKFHRLSPGNEVRLRWGYVIRCTEAVVGADGSVTELRATYDPATRGGDTPDGRKVKGTIHWVSADHCVSCRARLIEPLFTVREPEDLSQLNPTSWTVIGVLAEPSVLELAVGTTFQFERKGYFCVDPDSDSAGEIVLNRTVSLKDSYAKQAAKTEAEPSA